MRVNCNISAIIANNQLGKNENLLSQTIERLSSGLRINHAMDDASGMAISKKMHSQIKALEQSSRNTQDGVSVVQTAESALSELESMLQRIRELAVQAASDTNGPSDREAIQLEVDELIKEIDRVSYDTEYNTMTLLDGTLSRRAYAKENGVSVMRLSDTVNSGDYLFSVTSAATQASYTLGDFTAAATNGTFLINGAEVSFTAGETKESIFSKMQDACERGNAVIEDTGSGLLITNKKYGLYEELKIEFSNEEVAAMFGCTGTEVCTAGSDCEAEMVDGFSNTAKITTEGNIITIKDVNSFQMVIEVPSDTLITDGIIRVTDIGVMSIQSGANEGQQINIDIPKVDTHTLGLDYLNIRTAYGAGEAIDKLDAAIEEISSTRSKLGAYQNRLETTTKSLDEYNENITSALSRIEDCDVAEDMTAFTAFNVKTQAATSILSQANERPETILQLLQ